ncbi:Core-2/I-branching beta-1,6-N-acetylglucosaminyltransferase family protein [Thalictrum thalictroides]|uniref:Core-2/I-branching beta-1,6-N-acetylglucosaminyltransferase family protein n=1 Tax=Thalictrum thalictroides TaxID=46969 RepID=A0A7J6X5L0_THATH|nr:Core-2/I-branching beta-1,6-N-acetylglucosaminyltransferase family protein [Thalictrum thalictroides]
MISPTPLSLCCTLLLCLPLAFVFTSTTTTTTTPSPKPPILTLPQDDESLFRLASKVNSHPSPSTSPKRIAFMFLTTTPLPFAPLWELFFHPNQTTHQPFKNLFNIYIHADPNSSYNNSPFTKSFSNRVIHSKPTQRFTPTLIAAARRLLAHALLHDSTNSMFALLSPTNSIFPKFFFPKI